MILPRSYQSKAVDTTLQRFESGVTRQVLSLATGLGKTVVFALLAKKLNKRTLILAHRDELLQQACDKVSLVWPGVNIGIVKAERNEIDRQVVVASIQSACRPNRLTMLQSQGFDLCIVDEAHHSPSDSYKTVLGALGFLDDNPKRLLLGVSATVKRADGTGLDAVFQEITFEISIKEGIDQGYLVPLIGRQVFSKIDLKGIGLSCGDFITSELSRVINTPSRNGLIVDTWLKHASDRRRTVGFCADIRHTEDLAASFQDRGVPAASVHGSLGKDERRQVLSDFSDGKYRVLLNCMLLTEGFDCPQVDCLILGRPTKSEPLFVQMVGRATRLHPSKQNALILDFADNSSKHRLCSICNSLEGVIKKVSEYGEREQVEDDLSGEKKAINAPVEFAGDKEIDFFDRREFEWSKVGHHWKLYLSPACEIWVKKVEGDQFDVRVKNNGELIQLSNKPLPLEYACGLGEDWARKNTTRSSWARKDAPWRSEPATPKQLETLSKMGFTLDPNLSKGDASRLLDTKLSEPATNKQLGWLRSRGISFPKEITKIQAKQLIASRIT